MSGRRAKLGSAAAMPPERAERALKVVKAIHTLVWALFAGCAALARWMRLPG